MEREAIRAIYAHVIIKLLQGPIYNDEKALWRDLLAWKTPVKEYFGKIGIDLIINETDGFARVMQPDPDEGDASPLPRLMKKQALNYEATMLCVMLREMLEEHDARGEAAKLFLTQKDIKERIELFFKEQSNKSKLWRELSRPIESLRSIGILKLTREDPANRDNHQYEVKRIIKALVSNDKLEEIKTKLTTYVNDTLQQQ
jgi:hypothetical protein